MLFSALEEYSCGKYLDRAKAQAAHPAHPVSRANSLSTRIRYLLEFAAREDEISQTQFVIQAISDALKPRNSPHLLNEGLWHCDVATRLYLLVTGKPHLLNEAERKLWKRIAAMPELLNDAGTVDRQKLSANWLRITEERK